MTIALQRLIHSLLKSRGNKRFQNYEEAIEMPDGSQWLVEVKIIHRGDN